MNIEIVNHTHNYSRLLAYQLSSLILHPTKHGVTYTVFYDPADVLTAEVLWSLQDRLPSNVRLLKEGMPARFLKNRAIGRNRAAKRTRADWVWFTDTDYVFGEDCLDGLAEALPYKVAQFAWPGRILETDWPTGDSLIEMVEDFKIPRSVSPQAGVPKRMSRGIGGVQIAHGPTVKAMGYCPDWEQGPRDDWDFRSDVAFRKQFVAKKEIEVPNVIRIRHSKKGYACEERHEVRN